MKTSAFLNLDWRDLAKGLLVGFIAFLLNWLQITFIPALDISPEIKTLLLAGIAYLSKNLFTKEKTIEK